MSKSNVKKGQKFQSASPISYFDVIYHNHALVSFFTNMCYIYIYIYLKYVKKIRMKSGFFFSPTNPNKNKFSNIFNVKKMFTQL